MAPPGLRSGWLPLSVKAKGDHRDTQRKALSKLQPQPQRISEPALKFTRVPNSIIQFQNMFPPAELRLVLIAISRPGLPISDEVWQQWTGLDRRMKDMAIKGAKEKGLEVMGRGDKATFSFDRDRWQTYHESRPRDERGRTKGRSKSVTAKKDQQIHEECRNSGCSKLCETQVIPFPATKFEKPVSQTEDKNPPPNVGFLLTLVAVQKYFPHADSVFVEKLIQQCIRKKLKNFTDHQLAYAVHAARKDRPNQKSEGLFLHTVPDRLATTMATGAHLTEPQRREIVLAERVLENPGEWAADAIQQARDILQKYGV